MWFLNVDDNIFRVSPQITASIQTALLNGPCAAHKFATPLFPAHRLISSVAGDPIMQRKITKRSDVDDFFCWFQSRTFTVLLLRRINKKSVSILINRQHPSAAALISSRVCSLSSYFPRWPVKVHMFVLQACVLQMCLQGFVKPWAAV